jgi:hypothetical protein
MRTPSHSAELGLVSDMCVCKNSQKQLVFMNNGAGLSGLSQKVFMNERGSYNAELSGPFNSNRRAMYPDKFGKCPLANVKNMQGTTAFGFNWPRHVGHEQECIFPMIQL